MVWDKKCVFIKKGEKLYAMVQSIVFPDCKEGVYNIERVCFIQKVKNYTL